MKLAKTLGWPLGGKGDHPRLATEPAGLVSLGFGFLNPNPTGTILVGTDLLVPGWAIIGEEDSGIHYFWWPWHVDSTWSSLPAHGRVGRPRSYSWNLPVVCLLALVWLPHPLGQALLLGLLFLALVPTHGLEVPLSLGLAGSW